MATIAWHTLSVKETLQNLKTSSHGLSRAQALSGIRKYGANTIKPEPTRTRWQLFIGQFSNPLIYILLVATVISSYIGETLDAAIILGIVFLNAIIGYIQEQKAEESLKSIAALLSPKTRVIRDGIATTVLANQITLGDIVELEEGTQVPADLRIIQSLSLLVDEASLTGESIPTEKTTRVVVKNTPLAQRNNLAFAGTNVSSGRGLGVVIAIGLATEFGSMVEITSVLEDSTPLADELGRIGKASLWTVLAITGVLGVVGLIQQRDPISLLLTAIATAVSAVPEGLPVLITVTLAMGVQRLAKQHVAIRRLASLETLGQIDTIVSDKTGTLTENELTVQRVLLPDTEPIHIGGTGYEKMGHITHRQHSATSATIFALKRLATIGILANNAKFEYGKSKTVLHGDPTEGALLTLAEKLNLSIADTQESSRRIGEVPFSSNLRFMATIHTTVKKDAVQIAAKGNPLVILDRCTKVQHINGSTSTLSEKQRETIQKDIQISAVQGYRVLALATARSSATEPLTAKHVRGLTYIGCVAMLDAPRPTAIQAIQAAVQAGIRIVMATGDTAATAGAVSKQLGLLKAKEKPLTESNLLEASDTELESAVRTHAVFAEISPKMKLQLVRSLQQSGSIVAVTGDGANDAPILKGADIGIAMGKGSTDIARDVADMVLLDNNFASIPIAITEGRRVAATLRRVAWYILATNLSELVLLGITLAIGLPLPLLPTQILWINIITDGIAVSGLLFEPLHSEHDSIGSRILTSALIKRAIVIAGIMGLLCTVIFFFTLNQTSSLIQARSVTLIAIAALHFTVLLATRSLYLPIHTIPLGSNPKIIFLTMLSALMTLAIVSVPTLQQIFHTTALSSTSWSVVAVATFVLLGSIETQKEHSRASNTDQHKKRPKGVR